MNRSLPLLLSGLLLAGLLSACNGKPSAAGDDHAHGDDAHGEHDQQAAKTGPRGGRLLSDGDFTIELAIVESGVPPEFRAWPSLAGKALDPGTVQISVELARLGGDVDRIAFAASGDFLRSNTEVSEPHSFDVSVTATYAGQSHSWRYASHEGRVEIASDIARQAGIETAVAGPGVIEESLTLYGTVSPDATRVRAVKARFPGVIRSVSRQVGDRVRAGDTLATVESNESLRSYAVTAPIAGVVTQRRAEPGEQAESEALFEVADFSGVWAEFSAYARDRSRLRNGQTVEVIAEGGQRSTGTIGYVSPLSARETQSISTRVVLDNQDGRWSPGQFVEGRVRIAQNEVPLAVPLSALQRFRDFDVVFAQFGEAYEVRMLQLGRRDSERVEVLAGLKPGTRYVVANSYLIKADIEKSGASHDH